MPTLHPAGRHADWHPAEPGLLALDVDGTLVGPDGAVADEVVAAIARAVDAGLHVGLATGRMALGVTDVLARTGLPGPHVLHNGAQVVLDGEVVRGWPLPEDAVGPLLDACTDAGVYVEAYVADGFVVNVRDERARVHWELLGHEPLDVVDGGAALGEVAKVTAMVFPGEDADRVERLLAAHGLRPGAAGSPATPDIVYVNGTHPDADKGAALRAAAALVGVDVAATVAIGDGGNDLPLLAVAGTAIAMGQAGPAVRAAAHLRAPTVEEHGAAVAIDAAVAGWAGLR